MTQKLAGVCYFDGGSRGNPGPAGCAIVLIVENKLDHPVEIVKFLGDQTNNVGEYEGLCAGMRTTLVYGITDIQFMSDSKLVVEQVLGAWKVKEPRLRVLCAEAQEMATKFEKCEITHVRRELNTHADRLVTEMLDRYTGVSRQ